MTLYVDGSLGLDTNPGTAAKPYQSISAAISKALWENDHGVGTKVLVNPGTYHESVNMGHWSKQTTAPLTLQAAIPGSVYISGADRYTGWSPTSQSGVYQHSWVSVSSSSVPGGWPTGVAPIVYRREMLFINSAAYTQVTDPSWMNPGTFFVDDNAGSIYVSLKKNVDLATADVEVTRRANLLTVNGRQNVVLRGLIFEYGMAQVNASTANIFNSNNVLVDGIRADWNSWGGFGIHLSTNVTIQNSFANHNGGEGFNAYRNVNLLFSGNEADFNGWRSAQAAFYDFGMGGTKFFNEHQTTVEGYRAFNNYAQGLWFDTDNRDIIVDHAFIGGSFNPNIQVELNYGPITIQNSTLCSGGVVLNIVNSSQLTVQNTAFYDNGGTGLHQAEVYMAGKQGGRSFTDWQTGAYRNIISQDFTFLNNTVEDPADGQQVFSTYQTGSDWQAFQSSLHSDQNRWFDHVKTKAWIQGSRSQTLAGWRALTTQDQASTWASQASLATACSLPRPGYYDFQIFSDAPYSGGAYKMTNGVAVANLQLWEYEPSANASHVPSPSDFSLQVLGLPSGVTATLSPMTQNPRGLALQLKLAANASAAVQTRYITVLVTSNGSVRTMTFPVAIRP